MTMVLIHDSGVSISQWCLYMTVVLVYDMTVVLIHDSGVST